MQFGVRFRSIYIRATENNAMLWTYYGNSVIFSPKPKLPRRVYLFQVVVWKRFDDRQTLNVEAQTFYIHSVVSNKNTQSSKWRFVAISHVTFGQCFYSLHRSFNSLFSHVRTVTCLPKFKCTTKFTYYLCLLSSLFFHSPNDAIVLRSLPSSLIHNMHFLS